MPFPMKIQPIDFLSPEESTRYEPVKPVFKSRFKRLFDRQFSSVLKISAPQDKTSGGGADSNEHHGSDEFDPSSVCLNKMVENFIEESIDKQQKCSRNRCNCFNGNGTDSSDEEADSFNFYGEPNHMSSMDDCEILKSLVPCACVSERNLLADTAKIVERNKISKRKDQQCRKIVADGLLAIGYDASICKSRWEKSSPFPAGEYEYVDVIIEGERMIIDIDFRSEFDIARSTKAYKSILQALPNIFVGKGDRLQRIISIVSEAAKQSLKKKGMPFPPWRKAEYVKAKWLSPHTRTTLAVAPGTASLSPLNAPGNVVHESGLKVEKDESCDVTKGFYGQVETVDTTTDVSNNCGDDDDQEKALVMVKQWKPPETKPKSSQNGVKISSGLASVMQE